MADLRPRVAVKAAPMATMELNRNNTIDDFPDFSISLEMTNMPMKDDTIQDNPKMRLICIFKRPLKPYTAAAADDDKKIIRFAVAAATRGV